MGANPIWGVLLSWLGGVTAASFYVPFRKVRGWSGETYWLVAGVMSWIAAPWLVAGLLTVHFFDVLHAVPPSTLFWTYSFGVLWGVGGLTFGLTMRYLGMSLGSRGHGQLRGLRNACSSSISWPVSPTPVAAHGRPQTQEGLR